MIGIKPHELMFEIEVICTDRHIMRIYSWEDEYILERHIYSMTRQKSYPVIQYVTRDTKEVDKKVKDMLELCQW